ncbi:amidase [Nocardioides terrisoli]|uniref:amidase n=1 Tax=Nocardioides terrisoli TaxID=3388267 RepID=UPI00287B7B3E|nr:amidase [Nocardioides marmorisolisilvae]
MNLADLGAGEIARTVGTGDITAGQVVEDCLARIAERDPALNAFSVVLADRARAEADRLDDHLQAGGQPGPLQGVPVAVKEEIDVVGCVTTFGGRGNSTPARADSEVVRRLREAGAVVIGKTRMPEFGQWPFTESVAGGHTRNPWDRTRTPGGSSGGTAVAVAAGMVPFGLGGDGGGSIRIPAACCGLFGLKPERGRVTSSPVPHLWWSLGTIGPLTRSVLDSALVYDVLRGNVDGDMFRAADPSSSFVEAALRPPGTLRVGWSTAPVGKGVRPDLQSVRAVRETADALARLGHDVREVDPHYPDPTAAFVPQFFGGVRSEADAVEHFDRLERRTRETYRLGSWVTQRVLRAALRAGERVAERADRVFAAPDGVDVLLTPTIAERPRAVGALDTGGTLTLSRRAMPMIAYTALWNVTGHPAASVPAGIGPDALPLAVQLVGRRCDETTLLSLAAQLERERPWSMPAW